jgi:hypothetical protein
LPIGLNAPMPDLTRRSDPHRANSWLIHYGDDHVRTISKCAGNPGAADAWPRCAEPDFQAWRDHQAWTKEKYARLDRGEPMPPDWRVGELRPPKG